MRRVVICSLLLSSLAVGGCKKADPNAFEPLVEKLQDAEKRDSAVAELTRIVKVIAAAKNDERKSEFVVKVLPAFEAVWPDAGPHQGAMLEMAREIARPEAAGLWSKALELDGTTEANKNAVIALQGIRAAKAKEAAPAVIALFDKLIADPGPDSKGNEIGLIRRDLATTLGALGDKSGSAVLTKALMQPNKKQPVAVHRAAATALETAGDDSAIPALISLGIRIKDTPDMFNIGERSKRALAAIGESAVQPTIDAMQGKSEELNQAAEAAEVHPHIVRQSMVGILGAIGSKSATQALLDIMPKTGCEGSGGASKKRGKGKKNKRSAAPAADDAASTTDISLRAFVANSLGWIRDPAAVAGLCACRDASHNPYDMSEISDALGRIGGAEAVACLEKMSRSSFAAGEDLAPQFIHEIRWRSLRNMARAATPADVPTIQAVIASEKDPIVAKEYGAIAPATELLEKCKADKDCYLKVLADLGADPVAREKAAFELVRLAPGDAAVATELAKAYRVRDVAARINIAALVGFSMQGKSCTTCVEAIEEVLDAEKGNASREQQGPMLTAQLTIARLNRLAPQ